MSQNLVVPELRFQFAFWFKVGCCGGRQGISFHIASLTCERERERERDGVGRDWGVARTEEAVSKRASE